MSKQTQMKQTKKKTHHKKHGVPFVLANYSRSVANIPRDTSFKKLIFLLPMGVISK